jgi:hypothetical protein
MRAQERALADLCSALEETRIPYMLVGGQANAVWGVARATLDIDVTIWAADRPDAVSALGAHFRVLVNDPAAFVRETRVLPLESAQGVRIDVIFGLLPFEEEAVRRARRVRIGEADVRVCTPEDLILMKIVSERPRDLDDAHGVASRRLQELDLAYLEPRIHELAALLERPGIERQWQAWKREASDIRSSASAAGGQPPKPQSPRAKLERKAKARKTKK